MCKYDQIIQIDNAHRGAGSTSDSDFEIDLDHPLILDDNNGVAIKSLTMGNPLKTVNAGINDKLYFRLGVLDRVLTLTANTYTTSSLVTEIQTTIDAFYTGTPSINFAAGEWTMIGANTTDTWAGSGYVYTYEEPAGVTRTVTFTAFDVNNGNCTSTIFKKSRFQEVKF